MGSPIFGSFNNFSFGEENGFLPNHSRFEASTSTNQGSSLMGSPIFGSNFSFEEENEFLPNRSRFEASTSTNQHVNLSPSSMDNTLLEQGPTGLKLRKTPSFLELYEAMRVQKRICSSSGNNPSTVIAADEGRRSKNVPKAANFQASLLKIGSWEFKSIREGDLLVRCYYAKRKLVWEFLEGQIKSKMEIEWSDITGFNADFFPDNDSVDTLTIVLARKPCFFREIDPQPRSHTRREDTSDFTNGQASTHVQHIIHCPAHGKLNTTYENIIECDERLRILSQQQIPVAASPFFAASSTINSGSFLPSSECHDGVMLQNISRVSSDEDLSIYSMDLVGVDHQEDLVRVESLNNLLGLDVAGEVEVGVPAQNDDNYDHLFNEIDAVGEVEVGVPAQNDDNYDYLFNEYDSTTYDHENMMMQPFQAPGGGVVNVSSDDDDEDYGRLQAPAPAPGLPREDSFSNLLFHIPRIASVPEIFNDDLYENAEANIIVID